MAQLGEVEVAKVRAICQKWVEYSANGERKPDGYTIHLSVEERAAYIDNYWKELEKPTPLVHSAPYGTPYLIEIDPEMAERIKIRGHGQWRPGELPQCMGSYFYL